MSTALLQSRDPLALAIQQTTGAPVLVQPEQNPALAYLRGLRSEASRRTMRTALTTVAGMMSGGLLGVEDFPWHLVRSFHLEIIQSQLLQMGRENATVNKHVVAMRMVVKKAEAMELPGVDARTLARCQDVRGMKPSDQLTGRSLTPLELRNLFMACDDGTALGVRDAAMLAILYMGGAARREEAVNLDLADYDRATGRIEHRHGKGNKKRFDYLAGGGKAAVDAWLDIRPDFPGPLLLPVAKGGVIEMRRLSDRTIYKALITRGEKAGVKDFSPHDIRRTAVSDYIDTGTDLVTVSKKAGHSSVTQTAKYDRRHERVIEDASHRLYVPYGGK